MPEKKVSQEVKKVVDELIEKHREHLYEIFAQDTFNLTFDEREGLISGKSKEETCKILEKHIEEDPISKNKNTPDETYLCICGTEAILCKDKENNARIYKREIKTKSGPVTVEENGYYCSKCRKVFFPSPKSAKTTQRKLQS